MTSVEHLVTEANVSTIGVGGPVAEDTILMTGAENPITRDTTLVADVGGLVTGPLASVLVVCLKILLVIPNTCKKKKKIPKIFLHIKQFTFENILIQNKQSINSAKK